MAKENSIMKCKEKGCEGEINGAMPVILQTSCASSAVAFPCDKCNRLHWPSGDAVFNRSGERAFRDKETGRPFHLPVPPPAMKRPKAKN